MYDDDKKHKPQDRLRESLAAELRDQGYALAAFSNELKNLREDADSLSKIIRDGNGQPSLVTQVSLLDNDIDNLKKENEWMAERLKDIDSSNKLEKRENRGQNLKFYGSLIPALLALIAAILTLILK